MLERTLQAGSIPVLQAVMRFAGQRQRLLANNIANITTPNYQMRDVSPQGFQRALGEAVAKRRERTDGGGPLPFRGNRQVRPTPDGGLRINPQPLGGGVLLHDRNNRDVERLMQDMTENYSAYRVAADLLRSRGGVLRAAISERVA